MTTRFYFQHGLVIIPAYVSGVKKESFRVLVAIDTGSCYTNLTPETLDTIGAIITNEKTILLGVGETVHSNFAMVESLGALGLLAQNVYVTCNPLPEIYAIDGLIGNDILQFYKLTIDYPNQTISIE